MRGLNLEVRLEPNGHLLQQCDAGLIQVRIERDASEKHERRLAFLAPPVNPQWAPEQDVLQWAIAGLGI